VVPLGEKSREVRRNNDGSRTEKVKYDDGSGHDKTTRNGDFVSYKKYKGK